MTSVALEFLNDVILYFRPFIFVLWYFPALIKVTLAINIFLDQVYSFYKDVTYICGFMSPWDLHNKNTLSLCCFMKRHCMMNKIIYLETWIDKKILLSKLETSMKQVETSAQMSMASADATQKTCERIKTALKFMSFLSCVESHQSRTRLKMRG